MSMNCTAINVLSEDTFLDEIGKIIERDFFPDLPSVRSQLNDEPQLLHTASPTASKHSVRQGSKLHKNKFNPHKPDAPNIPEKLSLDQFLENYTSEDNFNFFTKLREDEDRKHRARCKWLYDQQKSLKNTQMNALMFHPAGFHPTATRQNRLGIRHKNSRTIRSCGSFKVVGMKNGKRIRPILGPVCTPTPRPDSETPLVTWGQVESTPVLLPKEVAPKTFRKITPNRSPLKS